MTTRMATRVGIVDGMGGNSHFLAEVIRSQTEPQGVRFTIIFCMENGTSEHCLIHLTITAAELGRESSYSFQITGFDGNRPIQGVYDTHTRKGYFEYV